MGSYSNGTSVKGWDEESAVCSSALCAGIPSSKDEMKKLVLKIGGELETDCLGCGMRVSFPEPELNDGVITAMHIPYPPCQWFLDHDPLEMITAVNQKLRSRMN